MTLTAVSSLFFLRKFIEPKIPLLSARVTYFVFSCQGAKSLVVTVKSRAKPYAIIYVDRFTPLIVSNARIVWGSGQLVNLNYLILTRVSLPVHIRIMWSYNDANHIINSRIVYRFISTKYAASPHRERGKDNCKVLMCTQLSISPYGGLHPSCDVFTREGRQREKGQARWGETDITRIKSE